MVSTSKTVDKLELNQENQEKRQLTRTVLWSEQVSKTALKGAWIWLDLSEEQHMPQAVVRNNRPMT